MPALGRRVPRLGIRCSGCRRKGEFPSYGQHVEGTGGSSLDSALADDATTDLLAGALPPFALGPQYETTGQHREASMALTGDLAAKKAASYVTR